VCDTGTGVGDTDTEASGYMALELDELAVVDITGAFDIS